MNAEINGKMIEQCKEVAGERSQLASNLIHSTNK